MNVRQRTLLSCAVATVLGVNANVLAQDTKPRSVLEEVIVTAQKREETLQDTPVAVTAFTGEIRDVLGINSVADLADFTPGLAQSTTQDRISLRGIGRLTNNYGSDPGVATYSDGVYTASTTEAGKPQIFVDRVEVLRGPQGTLYGRNSIGGAINVISRRPTDTFESEVRLTAGSYDTMVAAASVSGPITDWLRYRAVGSHGGQNKGFFENVNNDRTEGNVNDDTWAEAQLEFNLGDSVEGWIKYTFVEWDQARRTGIEITPYDIAPLFNTGLFPNATYNGAQPAISPVNPLFTEQNPSLTDRRKYNTDTPFRALLTNTDIVSAELITHLGWADLKVVGGYQGYTYNQVNDFDTTNRFNYTVNNGPQVLSIFPTVEGFYQEDKEYNTAEVNLISTTDGPLQWIAGLYYYHEDVYNDLGVRAPNQPQLVSPLSAPSPVAPPGPSNPEHYLQIAGVQLVANARAAFGQIDYELGDHWKATLGVRYTEDDKRGQEFRTRVVYGFVSGNTVLPFAFYSENNRRRNLEGEWHATTGTAGIEWTPNDDTLAFAKYTRGYKSGGFNGGQFVEPIQNAYTDPEFIDAYELGLKQTLFERVVANLSVFYYDYQDLQVPLSVFDPVTNLNTAQFFNISDSELFGAELESVWAITDNLQWRLTYSYLDTEIKDESLCVTDPSDRLAQAVNAQPCTAAPVGGSRPQYLKGNSLQNSPESKIATNLNYTFIFPAGSFIVSGTWTYRDEIFSTVFTREHDRAPAYSETDFRLLWRDAKDRFTVIGYLQNAFDDEGYERASSSQSAWGVQSRTLHLTAPRTYGLELQYRFGN
jgi:iron complex outermembrane receptor protein